MAKRSVYGKKIADEIFGTSSDEQIFGYDGNDVIYGGAGADTIRGGNGDDRIDAGDGADWVSGGRGNDTILGGTGNDYLKGDSGRDTIDGGDGADRIYGGSDDDTLHGGAGNDVIFGGSGFDILNGGDGNDVLNGDTGNDTIAGGAGRDTVKGGKGDDRLAGDSFEDTGTTVRTPGTEGTNVAVTAQHAVIELGDDVSNAVVNFAGDGTLFGRFRVTAFKDGVAVGSMVLEGYGEDEMSLSVDFGDDVTFDEVRLERIYEDFWTGEPVVEDFTTLGFAVSSVATETSTGVVGDWLDGGWGKDVLFGSVDNDKMFGGLGDDVLMGSGGSDVLHGGLGFDTVDYSNSSAAVVLTLSELDDDGIGWAVVKDGAERSSVKNPMYTEREIGAGVGHSGDAVGDQLISIEKLILTAGNDRVMGSANGLEVRMGAGHDIFDTRFDQTADDVIYGEDGEDKIFAGGGNDTLYGGNGSDTLLGEAGDDTIYGGADRDWISGGDGDDLLDGGDGWDTLMGGAGNDVMRGGADGDYLQGGDGNDTMDGGTGDDTLWGGAGNDTMVGGEGNDNFYIMAGEETGTINFIFGEGNGQPSSADSVDTVYMWRNGGGVRMALDTDFTYDLVSGSVTSSSSSKIAFSSDAVVTLTLTGSDTVYTLQGVDQILFW